MTRFDNWLEALRIALKHRYGLAPVLTGPFVPRRSPRRSRRRKRSSIRNAKNYEETQPHQMEEK
jgi:hypothetical protein